MSLNMQGKVHLLIARFMQGKTKTLQMTQVKAQAGNNIKKISETYLIYK